MATITKRGETFQIVVSLGYDKDETYKQRRKTTTFKPPEGISESKALKLAKAAAYNFEMSCKGLTAFNENMTLCSLFSWYCENVAPNKIRYKTILGYKKTYTCYIAPTLANKKLKDISPAYLDTIFNTLHKQGSVRNKVKLREDCPLAEMVFKKRTKIAKEIGIGDHTLRDISRGIVTLETTAKKVSDYYNKSLVSMFTRIKHNAPLAATSVKNIVKVLNSMFSAAVKAGIVKENPIKRTTPPKGTDRAIKTFIDEQDARKFLGILDIQPEGSIKSALYTALFLGLRSGELRALHWHNVDFEKETMNITHDVDKIDGKYVLDKLKNRHSQRFIKLPQAILRILKNHKIWQEEYSKNLGTAWKENGIIFANSDGGYLNAQYLNTKFKRIIKGQGFPENLHLHDLRHACASLLIHGGATAETVAKQLGHSSATTTQLIYTHAFQSAQAAAMDALEFKLLGTTNTGE